MASSGVLLVSTRLDQTAGTTKHVHAFTTTSLPRGQERAVRTQVLVLKGKGTSWEEHQVSQATPGFSLALKESEVRQPCIKHTERVQEEGQRLARRKHARADVCKLKY